MKSVYLSNIILLLTIALATSCTKDQTPIVATEVSCDSTTITFVDDIQPILSSNCTMSGCHNASDHKEGYDFSDYAGVLAGVKAGDANDSKIYETITATDDDIMPPSPMSALTSAQISMIQTWINNGAENTVCTSASCTTTAMSYLNDIKPIIENNCTGCHNSTYGQSPYLNTYAELKAIADNGTLASTISYTSSINMPPAAKLSQCKIDQITSWIAAGAPNN